MRWHKSFIASMLLLAAVCAAPAQPFINGTRFEPPAYLGTSSGQILTNQDGWFLPAGSMDFSVYRYAGNGLNLANNPQGQLQFIAAQNQGNGLFPRAQRFFNFSQGDVWTLSFHTAASYQGPIGLNANNLSSFSLQPLPDPVNPATRAFIGLNVWAAPNSDENAGWYAAILGYNAAGGQYDADPGTPALDLPAIGPLAINRWHRHSYSFSLSTNRFLHMSITDVITREVFVMRPTDIYLGGGAASTLPNPDQFRFFVGGGTGTSPGNIMAWDNAVFVQGPTILPGDDHLRTVAGSTADIPGIGIVDFMGIPDLVTFGNADTLVRRLDAAYLAGAGTEDVVPIEFVQLHLQSVNPVLFNGTLYDVFVRVDPNLPSLGTATIHQNSANDNGAAPEGTIHVDFNLNTDVLFRAVDNPNNQFSMNIDNQRFNSEVPSDWSHHPPPTLPGSSNFRLVGTVEEKHFEMAWYHKVTQAQLTGGGDANGNGCVDDTDLAIVLEAFGKSCPLGYRCIGDVNQDGIVDDIDLAIVLETFGQGC